MTVDILQKRNKFLADYHGKDLLEKHSLTEFGVWQIFGDDPNCDFGGEHHNPDLGVVEGVLDDVISYAVQLDRFFCWGSGKIIKIKVKKVSVNELPESLHNDII